MNKNTQKHRFNDTHELATAATAAILTAANQAITHHGVFKLVLAGGTTPNLIYQALSQAQVEWEKWWIFWGDERCLAADDAERNSLMAKQAWLDNVAIPSSQIFPIMAEQGAAEAARDYEKKIAAYLPFDMVLLGMGEDGHTASLFPCHGHDETELVHAVHHAPKPPANRVSLSVKTLSDSINVLFLISGASKHKAVKLWQQGVNLPVAQIRAKKNTFIYIDQCALGNCEQA